MGSFYSKRKEDSIGPHLINIYPIGFAGVVDFYTLRYNLWKLIHDPDLFLVRLEFHFPGIITEAQLEGGIPLCIQNR